VGKSGGGADLISPPNDVAQNGSIEVGTGVDILTCGLQGRI